MRRVEPFGDQQNPSPPISAIDFVHFRWQLTVRRADKIDAAARRIAEGFAQGTGAGAVSQQHRQGERDALV